MAENVQVDPIEDLFTVDKVQPGELSVSYSKSVLDTLLENITFGFYQSPVVVTITAEDEISGIDYFTYSYGVQVGASSINVGKKIPIHMRRKSHEEKRMRRTERICS